MSGSVIGSPGVGRVVDGVDTVDGKGIGKLPPRTKEKRRHSDMPIIVPDSVITINYE